MSSEATIHRMLDALAATSAAAGERASTDMLADIMRCQREFSRAAAAEAAAPPPPPPGACQEGVCQGERLAVVQRRAAHYDRVSMSQKMHRSCPAQ